MRKVTIIFRNTVLFLLAAMLQVSCLTQEDGPSAARQSVMIEMSVFAGTMTKAGLEEDATTAEKTINNLRVYAFYGSRLAGYAVRQATSLGEPFYMDLELPESGVHNVEFYLVANEEEMAYENGLVQLSENMTKAQLEAVKFTALASGKSLPMYCTQTEPVNVDNIKTEANTADGHQGHFVLNQSLTFYLSRSLAKLSVYAAKTPEAAYDPQVTDVKLLAPGTREYSYLFPQSEATLDAISSRANDRNLLTSAVTVSKSVISGSAASDDPANYDEVVGGIYLPEVSAGTDLNTDEASYRWNEASSDVGAAVLHIEYSLGEGQELKHGYVYLPRIHRNHHMKVCILINAEGQIILKYTVADWDWDESQMQDWFFDYPNHSYLRHTIPLTEEDIDEKPSAAAEMSEGEGRHFYAYFQMTYPDNDTWKPTLEGVNGSKCTVKVYEEIPDAEDVLVFETDDPKPISVSQNWYRIEVYPRIGYMTAGETVNLALTYTPSGMEEAEYLLINGSYGNYFWQNSTDANYVTITMVN